MLTLAVQAGGESRRMGADKGLVSFLNQTLIQRVIDRLESLADEILVTTNRPDDYRFLNRPLFQDIEPGRGALGGLYTALQAASHPLVAVIACDMPFASRQLFAYQRDILIKQEMDVVIPCSLEGLEPFHAVYRRESCLPVVQAAIQQNEWKLVSWFPRVKVLSISPGQITRIDSQDSIFMNINTPEDLHTAEEMARTDHSNRI